VTFDESNGSQVEQVDSSVVGKGDPPCDAIKQLAIGDIRPQEDEVTVWWFPKLLMNKFPLMYLILRGRKPLL
jgi:hypothetical protein